MNKTTSLLIVALAISILFFIQLAGTLVEAAYVLDLMNLKLAEKILGLLFFFLPVLVFPFFRKFPRQTAWILSAVLLVARGSLVSLHTAERLLAAGLGAAAAMSLLFLLLSTRPGGASGARVGLSGGRRLRKPRRGLQQL